MTTIDGNAGRADAAPNDRDSERSEHLNRTLSRVGQGDERAFAEFYQLTSPKAFGVVVRMLRDRGEAEDVLQDVYTTVWRRADSFDPARGGAMTWLMALARNRAIDRIRQHREDPLDEAREAELVDEDPTPAVLAERSQERRRLELCLEALGPQQRRAIRDAFFSGDTYNELAERLKVPLGTMKSWIRRSLLQLKACLER
ncbi:sigma-70 family RNA polymerase sigma factor [Paraburkholderia phosphatilytica]|uniref:sigma-70 family RNA polymerase sigma factor n=1 Tax=Paraburkholderia phosphatilytica TaxID=2282883 RepID=UPI000E4C5EFD|nr:sigma-70 family RNA polymerase sigma factor [Paraburkholderia phosphatilytica]